MPIGNITVPAEVLEDFPACANRLGYTPNEMLWLLAESLCANPPSEIRVVTKKKSRSVGLPSNVIAFRTVA